MTVEAVIFDWGGTLTPWHTIDHAVMWHDICEPHFPGGAHARTALAIVAAERELWLSSERGHRSSTIFQVLDRAGVTPSEEFLAGYTRAWEPHTITDPQARGVLAYLRERQIRIGVLSNTMWPRSWHEEVFRRDGILELIDGAAYSSEIGWTKPHPEAFRAAMAAIGVADPAACVFVGDRPLDDVHGAKSIGMRAVLIPHSDVPPCAAAEPDAVIGALTDLPPLIEEWSGL